MYHVQVDRAGVVGKAQHTVQGIEKLVNRSVRHGLPPSSQPPRAAAHKGNTLIAQAACKTQSSLFVRHEIGEFTVLPVKRPTKRIAPMICGQR